jgi:hypothetical protein
MRMPETLNQSTQSIATGDNMEMNIKSNPVASNLFECTRPLSSEISEALETIRLTVLYPFPRMQEIVQQDNEEGNSSVRVPTAEEEFLIKLDSMRSKSAATPNISTSQERTAWNIFKRGQRLRIIEFGVSNDQR